MPSRVGGKLGDKMYSFDYTLPGDVGTDIFFFIKWEWSCNLEVCLLDYSLSFTPDFSNAYNQK